MALLMVFIVLFIFALAPLIFLLIAQSKVHSKAGYPGWSAFVPYYSQYVRAVMGGDENNFWGMLVASGASFVVSLIEAFSDSDIVLILLGLISLAASIAILVFTIKMEYNLARAFGQGSGFTVGLVLLPIVFYPMLAWGAYEYHAYNDDATSPYNGREYGYAEAMKEKAREDYNANLYSQPNPFHQQPEYYNNSQQPQPVAQPAYGYPQQTTSTHPTQSHPTSVPQTAPVTQAPQIPTETPASPFDHNPWKQSSFGESSFGSSFDAPSFESSFGESSFGTTFGESSFGHFNPEKKEDKDILNGDIF